jgi:hypothetical protein
MGQEKNIFSLVPRSDWFVVRIDILLPAFFCFFAFSQPIIGSIQKIWQKACTFTEPFPITGRTIQGLKYLMTSKCVMDVCQWNTCLWFDQW